MLDSFGHRSIINGFYAVPIGEAIVSWDCGVRDVEVVLVEDEGVREDAAEEAG